MAMESPYCIPVPVVHTIGVRAGNLVIVVSSFRRREAERDPLVSSARYRWFRQQKDTGRREG